MFKEGNNFESKDKNLFSLEEQINLAKSLTNANDKRNEFIEQFGGFDNFAEASQYVGDNRKQYDELAKKAEEARKDFDKNVVDKKALVKHLQSAGEENLAKRISEMFQLK